VRRAGQARAKTQQAAPGGPEARNFAEEQGGVY
jgi:hypothetical protein